MGIGTLLWAAMGMVGPPTTLHMPIAFEGRRWDYSRDGKIFGDDGGGPGARDMARDPT